MSKGDERANLELAILLILLALYLITKNPLVGLVAGLSILFMFLYEVYIGIKERGISLELRDLVISFVVVFIFFEGLKVVLSTPEPLTAVVSCSMLPTISRGDLLIVRGGEVFSPYQFNLTEEEYQEFLNPPDVFYKGKLILEDVEGSIYARCSYAIDKICKDFVENPYLFEERRGNVSFFYDYCYRKWLNGRGSKREICVTKISYNGKNYTVNNSGDIVVYKPKEGTLFSLFGNIVHRAVVELNVDGKKYYLTKGDNNNVFDIQFYGKGLGNLPVEDKDIVGKVFFSLPFLGYYKLFLSLYVEEGPECKGVLLHG